jgi:membrane protein implicated in regulation of membrane protease activity
MKRQMPLRPLLMKVLLPFVAGVFIAVFPWIEHNSIESGSIVPGFVLSSPNRLTPNTSVDTLTGDLAVDKTSPACTPTGSLEELDRYWGDEQSWLHYATLPWRAVMNIDATGYYVTTFPALLLFPLLLLLPYFWTKPARWLRWLFAGTVMMLIEWIFLANGIPWYGVSLLLGLVVALEALVIKAPDKPIKIATSVLLSLSLLLAFGMRLWQFEQQRNILEYSMGKISADGLREITIPYYDDISATVVDRYSGIPDRPYLYRVGTFISYFIPRNLEVIGANDHQLDMFNCLYAERNPKLTVDRLKKLGFNSIIFDTNTATIESDVNGSLHKKVNAFVDFVNNPEAGLQVLISDPDAGVAFVQIP